jgi:hypothetical protein
VLYQRLAYYNMQWYAGSPQAWKQRFKCTPRLVSRVARLGDTGANPSTAEPCPYPPLTNAAAAAVAAGPVPKGGQGSSARDSRRRIRRPGRRPRVGGFGGAVDCCCGRAGGVVVCSSVVRSWLPWPGRWCLVAKICHGATWGCSGDGAAAAAQGGGLGADPVSLVPDLVLGLRWWSVEWCDVQAGWGCS